MLICDYLAVMRFIRITSQRLTIPTMLAHREQ